MKKIFSFLISISDLIFEIKNDLNTKLKLELDYLINQKKFINNSYFFNKNKNFLSYMGNFLKSIKFSKYEIIFCSKESAEEMFFIQKGNVSIILPNNFKVYTFKEGDYFGEWDFFFNYYIREFKCITTTNCILYTLNKIDFENIYLKKFISEKQLMLNYSLKRYKNIKNIIKNNSNKYYKNNLTKKQKNLISKIVINYMKRKNNKKIKLNIDEISNKFIKIKKILKNHFNIINNDYFDYKKIE